MQLEPDNQLTSTALSDVNVQVNGLDELFATCELPCGKVLRNRLVKAATYEHLANYLGGAPNGHHLALYERWAKGGWGMLVTGNVQVCSRHLTLGADLTIPDTLSEESLKSWRLLARAIKGGNLSLGTAGENGNTLAIMQLSHAGRQSPNFIGGRWPFVPPLAPSAIGVGSETTSTLQSTALRKRGRDGLITRVAYNLLFRTPRHMNDTDIEEVVGRFVSGARLAHESGFDGVQLHAAHGYLLSQFISRKTNIRIDAFNEPLALLKLVVARIRNIVPSSFAVGLKLNAADYTSGGLSDDDGKAHLLEIANWGNVDWIEISGGDYESPEFMQQPSERQAFFESFSQAAVNILSSSQSTKPTPLVMLTGGLRTRAQFTRVIRSNHAHMLGLARQAILQPDLPLLVKTSLSSTTCVAEHWPWETEPLPDPPSPTWWPRLVGAGVGMAWYVVAMRRLAKRRPLPFGRWWVLIVAEMYFGEWVPRPFIGVLVVGTLVFLWALMNILC